MLSFNEVVDRFEGSVVAGIELNEFVLDLQRDAIGMVFVLENTDVIYVRLDEKGIGFIFEDARPEELELGEYGRTAISAWAAQEKLELALPCKIDRIFLKESNHFAGNRDEEPSGSTITFSFENSKAIHIANRGDEFCVEVS